MIEFPDLSDSDVAAAADHFLGEYHPSREAPVPIELIIESRLGIDIVPTPGLQARLGMDGFVTSDLKSIYVDLFVLEDRPNRYRFTLAHEVAHVVLHKKVFQSAIFRNFAEWRKIHENLGEISRARLEGQANMFAGLVLAPPTTLMAHWNEAIGRILTELSPEDQARVQDRDVRLAVATELSDTFEMSPESLGIRIFNDRLRIE